MGTSVNGGVVVILRLVVLCAMSILLVACDTCDNCAPITELNIFEPIPKSGVHKVAHGETLYEVAWRYGLDYRDVVQENRMQAPYAIHSGQAIHVSEAQNTQAMHVLPRNTEMESNDSAATWVWPARGKVIQFYSRRNKGIDIAGKKHDAIFAAAAGKVVYSGNGLRGYGHLIIVKHNSTYLSAYAHADGVYVREGDTVKKGQKIAEMGDAGSDRVMLHFEIRRAGKPVDPIQLLN